MKLQLTRRYPDIACSHRLHGLREGHKCGRLHGHNYHVEVTIEAMGELTNGMVLDAEHIDVDVKQILAELDHHDLNEVATKEGKDPYGWLAQPTVENICQWLWWRLGFLKSDRYQIIKIRVIETDRLWAEIEA